jgi:hypothetical protein
MSRWVPRVARGQVLCVALLCVAACGGGHGPTAPGPALPQVAGNWNGDFGISNFFAVRASLMLAQADDGTAQGVLFIFPNSINVAGTVTSTSFTFHSVGGCLAVAGTLALTVNAGMVTQMSGPTSQDFGPCGAPGGHPQAGTLALSR